MASGLNSSGYFAREYMKILPVNLAIYDYAKKRGLAKKLAKRIKLLGLNIRHPSLNVELLEPKHLRIYSCRVDKKYRALFIFREMLVIEILKITDHYK